MGLGARLESGKAGGGFCIKSKSGLLLMSLCLPHSPVLPPSGISTDLIPSNKHLERQLEGSHLEGLLKYRDSDSVGLGWAQEFAFLASFQVMLMVWKPHFENHRLSCFHGTTLSGCPVGKRGLKRILTLESYNLRDTQSKRGMLLKVLGSENC